MSSLVCVGVVGKNGARSLQVAATGLADFASLAAGQEPLAAARAAALGASASRALEQLLPASKDPHLPELWLDVLLNPGVHDGHDSSLVLIRPQAAPLRPSTARWAPSRRRGGGRWRAFRREPPPPSRPPPPARPPPRCQKLPRRITLARGAAIPATTGRGARASAVLDRARACFTCFSS